MEFHVPRLDLGLGESVLITAHFMKIHTVGVGAGQASYKVVAILSGSEGSS